MDAALLDTCVLLKSYLCEHPAGPARAAASTAPVVAFV
jgi:hypothetical protein